jgi:hypothetical protein
MGTNKMNLGIAIAITIMLIASLSAGLLIIPSKVATAQTSAQNMTMPGNQTKSGNLTKVTKVTLIPINIAQLRDQIRSNHPLLAAIADRIQTLDAKDTLKYTIGVDIVADMLKAHARELVMAGNQTSGNQTSGNQTATR